MRRWIERYGVPHALYTDWKNVYVRTPNAEETATGAVPLTQFGRMCAALAIQIIAASSPQAKGRIERNHGTHQDRLVKKLRRTGIADLSAANAFLEAEYWAAHNERFTRPPASPDDFHVAIPRGVRLDTVFRLEEKRTVSNDWVVRYDNRYFQIERQSHHPPARSIVEVYEAVENLYVLDRPLFSDLPPVGAPDFEKCGAWKTASWRQGDKTYVLTGMSYPAFVSRFRKAGRWILAG